MRTLFVCLALLCVVNCGGQVPPGGPTMSTPMFIREPLAFGKAITNNDPVSNIVATTTEATLIEEVRYQAETPDTAAGYIELSLYDGSNAYKLPFIIVPAPAAGTYASGTETLDVVIPVGWSMRVVHYIQDIVPGDTVVNITALGGILR